MRLMVLLSQDTWIAIDSGTEEEMKKSQAAYLEKAYPGVQAKIV